MQAADKALWGLCVARYRVRQGVETRCRDELVATRADVAHRLRCIAQRVRRAQEAALRGLPRA